MRAISEYRGRRSLKFAVRGVGILVEIHRFGVGPFQHVERSGIGYWKGSAADDASTFRDVLAHWGDDGTKKLFRRLLEQAHQDLIDGELTAQIGAASGS